MLPNLRSEIAQLLRKPTWIGSHRNISTYPNINHVNDGIRNRVKEWMIRRGSGVFAGYMLTWYVFGDVAANKERQRLKELKEDEASLEARERRLEKLERRLFDDRKAFD